MRTFPKNKVGHKEIYKRHPDAYDAFMSMHDYLNNVERVLLPLLKPSTVLIDAGCGSGRIAKLAAPHVAKVYAFDSSPAMVGYLDAMRIPNVTCAVAPLGEENITDFVLSASGEPTDIVIVAAWSLVCVKQAMWANHAWKPVVAEIISTWTRRFRPARIIVLDNLGTGVTEQSRLGDLLEHVPLFASPPAHIRTDYAFPSKETALEMLTFFYGPKTAQYFVNACGWEIESGKFVVPEVTGVYVSESNG